MPLPVVEKTGPIPYVDLIIAAMTQVGVAIPIGFQAARGIIALFKRLHPELPLPTDAEVFAQLKKRASEDLTANQQWLADHPTPDATKPTT